MVEPVALRRMNVKQVSCCSMNFGHTWEVNGLVHFTLWTKCLINSKIKHTHACTPACTDFEIIQNRVWYVIIWTWKQTRYKIGENLYEANTLFTKDQDGSSKCLRITESEIHQTCFLGHILTNDILIVISMKGFNQTTLIKLKSTNLHIGGIAILLFLVLLVLFVNFFNVVKYMKQRKTVAISTKKVHVGPSK